METALLNTLDEEVATFPGRASGEQLYEHMNKVAARYAFSDRQALASALSEWLSLKSEPRTMLAADIAGNLRLTELRHALEKLLEDIEHGRAFMPHYARPIKASLALLT